MPTRFFPNQFPFMFLPYESLFICLHFDTKLRSLLLKIMAIEILMHKLFLTGVSTSSPTFFEYLSIIFFCTTFYTFYLKPYMFRTEIYSAFREKYLQLPISNVFFAVTKNISKGIKFSVFH